MLFSTLILNFRVYEQEDIRIMGLSSAATATGDGVKLCIFDLRRGQQDGEEIDKILFFYPPDLPLSTKHSVIGLSEGLITFTRFLLFEFNLIFIIFIIFKILNNGKWSSSLNIECCIGSKYFANFLFFVNSSQTISL